MFYKVLFLTVDYFSLAKIFLMPEFWKEATFFEELRFFFSF